MLIRASWQLQIAQVRADGCLSLRVGPGCDGLGGGLVSHGHDGVQQTRDTKCRGRGKGKTDGWLESYFGSLQANCHEVRLVG